MATIKPGSRGAARRSRMISTIVTSPIITADVFTVARAPERGNLVKEIGRHRLDREAQKILKLACGDDDGDADGKPVHHRLGHIGDQVPGTKNPAINRMTPAINIARTNPS